VFVCGIDKKEKVGKGPGACTYTCLQEPNTFFCQTSVQPFAKKTVCPLHAITFSGQHLLVRSLLQKQKI